MTTNEKSIVQKRIALAHALGWKLEWCSVVGDADSGDQPDVFVIMDANRETIYEGPDERTRESFFRDWPASAHVALEKHLISDGWEVIHAGGECIVQLCEISGDRTDWATAEVFDGNLPDALVEAAYNALCGEGE